MSTCKNAEVLVACETNQEVTCALGCGTGACKTFEPLGALTTTDAFGRSNENAIDFPVGAEPTIVDTTNGSITHPVGPVRTPNGNPNAAELVAGITFERRGGIGIFRAASWTLRNVIVRGDLPVAFVTPGEVKVLGHVSTQCGEAGGANADAKAGNGGNGSPGAAGGAGGAGGGGHGTPGGKGANAVGDLDEVLPGGAAGPVFTLDATNLRGGGRGGHGGPRGALTGGGAGGGVVIIVAGAGVKIGDGVTVAYKPGADTLTVNKGILVGGCGGVAGNAITSSGERAAGGGGAGGMIVIESPTIVIDANAGLAANGGGGGGTASVGRDARLDADPALGGDAAFGTCGAAARGGNGAAGAQAAQDGVAHNGACGEYQYSGGGGGGGGRIILHTRSGNTAGSAPTAILSPAAAVEMSALSAN